MGLEFHHNVARLICCSCSYFFEHGTFTSVPYEMTDLLATSVFYKMLPVGRQTLAVPREIPQKSMCKSSIIQHIFILTFDCIIFYEYITSEH